MSVRAETLKKQSAPVIDITNYWQHYGLHGDPFTTHDEEGTYYALNRWEEHLDLLQYLCHYNNVLGIVAGVSGSGKSSLMKQFIVQVGDTMSICSLTADGTLNTNQMLEAMSHTFHLAREQDETLEEQLDHLLATIQTAKKICVLVIDNAHLLATETLRTLLYLVSQQSETQKRLHVLLFGEPQLQLSLTRLTHIEGDPELLHPIVLEPFSLEETERYIQHRLRVVGLKGDFPLSTLETARIYKLSEGVPGRINRIARRTLLNALVRQQTEVAESVWQYYKTKIYGAGVLFLGLSFLVVSLSWLSGGKHPTLPQAMKSNVTAPKEVVLPNKMEPGTVVFAKNDDMNTEAIKIREALRPNSDLQQDEGNPEVAHADAMPLNNAAGHADTLVFNGNNTASLAAVMGVHSASPPSAAAAKVTPPAPTAVVQAPTPPPPAVVAAKVIPPPAAAPTAVEQAPTPPSPAIVATKVTPPAAVPTTVVRAHTSVASKVAHAFATVPTTVVRAHTPKPLAMVAKKIHKIISGESGYTLQLMGLSQEKAIKDIVHRQHLDHKVAYYHTILKGKDFYVLTYGHFKTAAEALAAVKVLPTFLRHQHPWPKALIQVEKEKHQRG